MKKFKLCLNSIFDSAIDNDLCYKNPAKKIPLPKSKGTKEKRDYTKEEAGIIIEYAKTHRFGLDVILLLTLGLRRGELLGLMWEDVDFENKIIKINRAVSKSKNKVLVDVPKTKASIRQLPFDSDLLKLLSDFKADSGYIIHNAKNSVYAPDNWNDRRYKIFFEEFKEVYKEMPILTAHELRHTCGTLLYKETGNIHAVSKFLGHSDILITAKIYVHNDIETLRKDLNL
jgi:integrase